MTNRKRREAGFNLIEVLIAMALLSTVLLSIVTLFFMGRSNVYSGKQLTRATSVAVHANEDIAALAGADFLTAFNVVAATTTAASNTVANVAYPKSIVRSVSADAGGANDPKGYLARWKTYLTPDRLQSANLYVVIMPSDLATSTDMTTARVIQVRVVTEWKERNRYRNVFIDTTKFNRSLQ